MRNQSPSVGFVRSLCSLVVIAALPCATGRASILSQTSLEIDFTHEADAAAKAAWSDTVDVGPEGLGRDGETASSRDGWIQTKPLAVGLWWRPGPSAGLRLELSPAPAPITLANGQVSTPWGGALFARYSADRIHWSDWQAVDRERAAAPATDAPAASTAPGSLRFAGTLGVPDRERQAYLRHRETYATLDVPWTSDEEALCRWIEAKDPEFFARSIPFVGYVEFLFENGFHGGWRITSLKAEVSYGISGMAAIPRDPGADRANDRSPWRFAGKSSAPRTTKP